LLLFSKRSAFFFVGNARLKNFAVAAILIAAGLIVWATPHMRPTVPGIGGPFQLTDDRGAPVTDRSFPGKYLIIYFGYSNCRDVCPQTLSTLAAALDRLGAKANRIQPLFITLDPLRDTIPVLHRYVTAFSPRLLGATGPEAELNRVAEAYHVTHLQNDAAGPGRYTLDHSSVLYLMAPDGRFVAPIPADAQEMVIAQAIARYVP
jgi:cytochrome oxidase Cu insertion factor (SCO1/SenC/PrrC family)